MKTLLLVLLIALMPVSVAWAEDAETTEVDNDWYLQLAARSGVMWNFETDEWTPYVTVPILSYKSLMLEGGTEIDVDENTEEKGARSFLLALTYNLGDLRDMGVGAVWAEHFGFNVGVGATREFGTGDIEWTAVLSVIDVSLGD